MKKIGELGYLMEIWRNQLKNCTMINVIATPFEELIENHAVLDPIQNEDQLSLELADVNSVEANKRITNCRTYLELNGQPVSYEIGNGLIDRIELDSLFNLTLQYVPTTPKKYITVLKIILGSKENDEGLFEIHPIFQPMVLIWNEYYPNSNNHGYVRSDNSPNILYQLENNRLIGTTLAQKNLWVQNYKDRIRIKHNDLENHATFRAGVDVMEVVFPFQTIYTLMKENNNDKFNLHNCIQKITHQETNPVKHAILISSPYNNPNTLGEFSGKYANRSHLCPPCNGVTLGYDLA